MLDDPDQIMHFYINDELQKNFSKNVEFIGSIPSYAINSAPNLKMVYKRISENSMTEFKETFEKINVDVNSLIFDATSAFDGPFEYNELSTFESIFKFKLVKFDSGNWKNYYDKILSVVNFYKDFSDKKLLITHDLYKLLNLNQVNEMNSYLKSLDIAILSIESMNKPSKNVGIESLIYSIDNDHVRFDY